MIINALVKLLNEFINIFTKESKIELETNNVGITIPNLERLPDDELTKLNNLLPWASYVVDSKSRRFGKIFSNKKRSEPQIIPDHRIVDLDKRFSLSNLHVLEVGCFEGIHTVALSERAKQVTAIDSRIENIVKTLVRCNMFGYKPDVFYLDLEQPLCDDKSLNCDILHHVGVLYHLTNPVEHLIGILEKVSVAIMLDTHVATINDSLKNDYTANRNTYRYKEYREGGRSDPFSGMKNHAKWLLEEDLISVLNACGFKSIDVAERRKERNGTRILLYANR